MKAINKLVVESSAYRTREIHGIEYAIEAARKQITATLQPYIKETKKCGTMTDTLYFWFDYEAFRDDMEKFGIEIPDAHTEGLAGVK